MSKQTHKQTHKCMQMQSFLYKCTYTYTYIHTYIHTILPPSRRISTLRLQLVEISRAAALRKDGGRPWGTKRLEQKSFGRPDKPHYIRHSQNSFKEEYLRITIQDPCSKATRLYIWSFDHRSNIPRQRCSRVLADPYTQKDRGILSYTRR